MKQRIIFLDWLRVIACLMVMFVHACECIYSNDYSFSFPSEGAKYAVLFYQSFVRPTAVPLFLMAPARAGQDRYAAVLQEKVYKGTDTPACLSAYVCCPAITLGRSDLVGCRQGIAPLLCEFPCLRFPSVVRVYASGTVSHYAHHLSVAGPPEPQRGTAFSWYMAVYQYLLSSPTYTRR